MKTYFELNVRSYACWWIVFCSLFGMYNCDSKCEDYTYFKEVSMWYKFNDVGKTFGDAYSLCKDENASVAVPKNQAEMDILMSIYKMYPDSVIKNSSYPQWLYVGIHGLFTKEEYLTLRGEGIQYIFHSFYPGQPDNVNQLCMVSSRNGTLADADCTVQSSFICERQGPPYDKRIKPTETYSYSYELRKSYKLHMDTRTWGYARTICDAEGGHLAIITGKSEEEHLTKLLNDNIVSYIKPEEYFVFIGFHDIYKEGLYITVKDDKLYDLPYINWSDGRPSGNSSKNCGGINKLGQIGDYNCDLKRPYICEKSE